jgi:hypothetical protein
MELVISYAHAVKHYPNEVQAAIAKLRKSKSKHRRTDPSTLKWKYTWGVEVKAHSFKDILSGSARRAGDRLKAMTLRERIDDEASRTKVQVCVGTGYYAPLPGVPLEIYQGIVEAQTHAAKERDEIEAMSDEERAVFVQKLMNQLRGPGFVAL